MGEDAKRGPRVRRARWRSECPDREPNGVYDDGKGYRVMRWLDGDEIVEMLEHRWVMDPGPGRQVHHIDHDRANNDPSNLEIVTTREHGERHRSVPDDELRSLHREGLSQVAIGERLGIHSSQVSRRAASLGLDFSHSKRWRRIEVDPEPILTLHDQGHRVGGIVRHLGLTDMVVRRVLRENGRKPHGSGRPPDHILNMPVNL